MLKNTDQTRFALFSRDFVFAYWQTVKSGAFPMPPNKPIEETLEELLALVSYTTEIQPSLGRPESSYSLRMASKHGDWWLFTFHVSSAGWTLLGCSAPSSDKSKPHDLLGPVYSRYFEPFLRHVTNAANAQNRI